MAQRVRPARKVTFVQLVALLTGFAVLSGIGGVFAAGLLVPAAAGVSAATKTTVKVFDDVPDDLKPGLLSEQSNIYASDGVTKLATFYKENRIVKPLSEISKPMQDAVIAIEDKRFYEHGGVDLERIPGAAVKNFTTGSNQGASTLTQQYVKNVLIEKAVRDGDTAGQREAKEDSAARKVREIKLAVSLENTMTKNEILAGYLNIAQFGTDVYGVETAALRYFSKSAKDLNYLEAATIAGVTKNPSRYDPLVNAADSKSRRDRVLNQMYQQKFITLDEYNKGRTTPLDAYMKSQELPIGCKTAGSAAFFCDWVTKEIILNEAFGKTKEEREELLYRGGLKIVTTLDMAKQAAAQKAIEEAVPANDPSGREAAMSAIEPGTGKILAMTQNRPYSARAVDGDGTTAINYNADQLHGSSHGFSPGSTAKLFALTEWLKQGHSLYEQVDTNVKSWRASQFKSGDCDYAEPSAWAPNNSDGQSHGMKSVAYVTANSVNTGFASMESQLTLCGIAKTADEVGFRPSLTKEMGEGMVPNPAMILGTQNTSPLAQTNAFATMAAGGIYCDPIALLSVTGPDGDITVPSANCRRVIDEGIANTVNFALQGVISNGSAKNARISDGRPQAGKTGTSQMSRHTWFIGYTPTIAAGVWVGNAEKDEENRNVRINGQYYRWLYGSSIAAPTWKRFMEDVKGSVPVESFGAPMWNRINDPTPPRPRPTEGTEPGTETGTGTGTDAPVTPTDPNAAPPNNAAGNYHLRTATLEEITSLGRDVEVVDLGNGLFQYWAEN